MLLLGALFVTFSVAPLEALVASPARTMSHDSANWGWPGGSQPSRPTMPAQFSLRHLSRTVLSRVKKAANAGANRRAPSSDEGPNPLRQPLADSTPPRGSSIMHASRFTSITPHPSSLAFVAVPHSPTAGSTAGYSASLRHTACPALLLPAQRMDRLIHHRRRVTTLSSFSVASGCQLQLSALLPSAFASAGHGASSRSPAQLTSSPSFQTKPSLKISPHIAPHRPSHNPPIALSPPATIPPRQPHPTQPRSPDSASSAT